MVVAAEGRHNLPVQLTGFIGRERERAVVTQFLRTTRLLTLTGTGGVGKTRLALETAAALAGRFAQGVRLVELAPLADPSLVPQTVASALGLQEGAAPPLERIAAHLRSWHLLLVLDNCEHLLPACARLADTLLRACPQLWILATSRQPLRIEGETAWRAPSMAVPRRRATDAEPGTRNVELEQADSVLLFLERARAVRPEFTLGEANAEAVAEVCRRLDGIPLAIELAAARISVLSAQQIAERLDDRFRLLRSANPLALPRHQTLRATLDWSHDLLRAEEQALFRRLAVFAGGFTLQAAEEICGGAEVLDTLSRLVEQSLVLVEEHDGAARYSLLETMREYAREKLRAAGEETALRDRHLAWYLALAEQYEIGFQGPDKLAWLDRMGTELPNVRAALGSARDHEVMEGGLRLFGALTVFWRVRSHLQEGQAWGETFLTAYDASPAARAKALYALANIAFHNQRFAVAKSLLTESVGMFRAAGDEAYQGHMLTFLGETEVTLGDVATSRQHAEEGVALCRRAGHTWHLAYAMYYGGVVLTRTGDPEAGRALLEESIALFRQTGDALAPAYVLTQLGELDLQSSDLDTATTRFTDGADLFRLQGEHLWQARCHLRLAVLAALQAATDQAEGHLQTARRLRQIGMSFVDDAEAVGVSGLLLAHGRATDAARILGAVGAAAAGGPISPDDVRIPPYHQQQIAPTRAALSEEAFAAAWADGCAVGLDGVVADVLATVKAARQTTAPVATATGDPAGLSAREIEVLRLIALGISNREIAGELVLSERTVERHIANIYQKLGLSGKSARAAAAAYALRQGLDDLVPDETP